MGQTPVLRCKGSWKKLSAIGVVAIRPGGIARELYLQLYEGAVNEDMVIAYLEELKKQLLKEGVLPGWVILIWDNLNSHTSKKVLEYLESQSDWLMVERLPPDAPELHPMEYVWSPIKTKDLANYCPENLDQLEEKVLEGANRMGDDKELLQRCISRCPLFHS